MVCQNFIKSDDVVSLDRCIKQNPKELYKNIGKVSPLEFAVENKAFSCASLLYARVSNEIRQGTSPLDQIAQNKMLTSSLIKLLPYLYDSYSAHFLFDRMVEAFSVFMQFFL